MGNGTSNDPNGSGGGGDQKIKVGEKEYTADDVQNLLSQAEKATQANQQMAVISDFMKKLGVESPEELVTNVDGAYTVLNNLLEAGVINENGELVANPKEGEPKKKGRGDSQELDEVLNVGDYARGKGNQKTADLIAEAVQQAVEPISKKLGEISDVQTSMIRKDVASDIKQKHPHLDDDDVDRIFGAAMQDKSKSIWQHAEAMAERKQAKMGDLEKSILEKYGLDQEELERQRKEKEEAEKDPNRIKQGGPEGGSSVLAEGKKISMRRGVKDAVHPSTLVKQYLEKVNSEG